MIGMDWDDVADEIGEEVNFRQVEKCCGNCKHAEWMLDGGECLLLSKRMEDNEFVGFGIWYNDVCNLWEKNEKGE